MAEIRQLCARFAEAFRHRDVDRIMTVFAPDVVSFDIVPPLRCTGADELRKHWVGTFASHTGVIRYEIHELDITVDGDLAVTHSLNFTSGTLTDGRTSRQWLRWTTAMRRHDRGWLIVHEHVSVPMDTATGLALVDETP